MLYYASDIVDAGNRTNAYINFEDAGASSDWCYLRQIRGVNGHKLAFDFQDDGNDFPILYKEYYFSHSK